MNAVARWSTKALAAPLDARDAEFLRLAAVHAARVLGRTGSNPSVGAIVVDAEGRVLARGATGKGGRPHAERIALDRAGARAMGATLYVTLEPCAARSDPRFGPSCTDAILAAGIARVVIGASDPSPFAAGGGLQRLAAAGVACAVADPETPAGVAARRLHRGHDLRVREGRPVVLLKLAATADGFVARRDGAERLQVSGPVSTAYAHALRARADAILVGVGTVLADDPSLTCRLPGASRRSPVRVVLDTRLRTPAASVLASTARDVPTWIVAGVDAPVAAERALRAVGVEVMRVDAKEGGSLSLRAALSLLATRGIGRVMTEGGPTLGDALARADLLDEVEIVTAPFRLDAPGIAALGPHLAAALDDPARFGRVDERRLGEDRLRRYEALR